MNLSDEEMKAIVGEATSKLKLNLANSLANKLDSEVTYAAINIVREHVKEWVEENVLPDVTAILVSGKVGLVNTAAKAAELMCEELSKSMANSLKENLEKSWDRKKIFEAMFS